ncbi:alpha-amylase family glycosyl hydrolase [Tenacibaculum sp. SG-28]|uniref:alpha-amylase family glycosyl hydrolase n=1 Tax=Tenacibaculum sp. SG-28 TaxID=754426 RepID=UPI001304B22F|nr:alpha-amylase family glycosyl hydrolase [Tenacibaculum sp. SG-28]
MGDNEVQPKFTKTASNTYTLTITGNVYEFYDVATTVSISEINIVARSEDTTLQTRPDIHIEVFSNELNLQFTNPDNNSIYEANTATTITAEATTEATLELYVNDELIASQTDSKIITEAYTFSTTGQQVIKAIATANGVTKETNISVYVKTITTNETKPTNAANGVTLNANNSVTFILLAPEKSDIFLLGDFNGWNVQEEYQMKKDGDYFWITISDLDPDQEYAYQYFIDYSKKIADPYARKVLDKANDKFIDPINYPNLKEFPAEADGIVSTFQIEEDAYNWQQASFTRPKKEELIIYELLVRDFSENDSYEAVISKLDYLEDLGVNAIELMPVNEFEGNDSWGYNVSHFFALDKAYGTKNKLKELIDKCHQRGIAVLLDVVYNHSYSQCPLVQMYEYDTNNGSTTNNPFYNDEHNFENEALQFGFDFNHESAYTQQYFKDVMSYWINEFKIDGFRLDFTKGFTNTFYPNSGDQWGNGYNQDRIDILKNYATHVWENHGSDFYMILEHLADNSEEKELANAGMLLWGNLNYNYNQNTMGFSNDTDIAWGYYEERGYDENNLVTYMESHDEERLMYKNLEFGNTQGSYSVKDLNTALQRQELAGLFFFSIPGPKMIWQFGELGYDISIDQNGRTGRKPVKWDYYDVEARKSIYDVWSQIISLRKENEVFATNDVTLNVNNLVKRINLNHSTNNVVLVGNFDVTPKSVDPNYPKTGTWYDYFENTTITVSNPNTSITLQPGEYKLLSSEPFDNALSISTVTTDSNSVTLYPIPSNDYVYLASKKQIESIEIFDTTGKLVLQLANYSSDNPIPISTLTNGLYIVKIRTEQQEQILKKLLVN